LTLIITFDANEPSVLVRSLRLSVKSPAIDPVFWMSTKPLSGSPPGFMFDADRIAAPSLLLSIDRLPELNVLAGFAE
jgi:hypothetical protein